MQGSVRFIPNFYFPSLRFSCVSIITSAVCTIGLLDHANAEDLPPVQQSQYALATQLSAQNINQLAFRLNITPHWIGEKSHQFWYFRDDPIEPSYILVNPSKKTKTTLFNQKQLAKALGDALGESISVDKLMLKEIEVTPDLHQVDFQFKNKHWSWLRQEARLSENSTKEKTKKTKNETISPDGKWEAFAKNGNLYVRELSTGKEQALTTDGTPDFAYGQQVVNPLILINEANGKSKNHNDVIDVAWSPDSKKIATIKMDLRNAGTLSLVQSSPPDGSTRPKTFNFQYALSGDEKTATASILMIDITTGKRVDAQLPPQAILYYGSPDFRWNADSKTLYSMQPERGYAALNLYKIDGQSGQAEILIKENTAPFADYYGHRHLFKDEQKEIYWTSDRSGWKHFERHDMTTGKRLNALTSGAWQAADIVQIDPQKKQVFLIGLGREKNRDPYLRHLYRVNKDGSALTLLTPEALDHEVSISPDMRYVVDNMSTADTPTRTVVRDSQSGAIVMDLETADISRLLETGFQLPQPFQSIAADGKTPIYGVLYKPVGFSAKYTYPIVDHIYTGPHTTYVPKSMARALKSTALPLTALDFAVVYVDGRGTNRRGREFLNYSYKNLGNNGYDDHEVAIRDIAKKVPNLDVNKVGIFGFSAGGYDTARAMMTRPDFYKVGWAASGNHDHRSDKAVWNEQWMGVSPTAPQYDRDSNLTVAKNLKGKLMIAHGELDTNVNPMASMQLINALIKANKNFEMLWVPNADHFLDDIPYYNRRRWDYFIQNLQNRTPIDTMK